MLPLSHTADAASFPLRGGAGIGISDPPESSTLCGAAERLLPREGTPFCLSGGKEKLCPDWMLGVPHCYKNHQSGSLLRLLAPGESGDRGSPQSCPGKGEKMGGQRGPRGPAMPAVHSGGWERDAGAERGFPDLWSKAGQPGADQRPVRSQWIWTVSTWWQGATQGGHSEGAGRVQGHLGRVGSREFQAPGQAKGDPQRRQSAGLGTKGGPLPRLTSSPAFPPQPSCETSRSI